MDLSLFVKNCLGKQFRLCMSHLKLNLNDYSWKGFEIQCQPSLPGKATIDNEFSVGYLRLKSILSQYPPVKAFALGFSKIIYITSSLGFLTSKLLMDFTRAVINDDSQFELSWPLLVKKVEEMVTVVFPSQRYIDYSFLGKSESKCLFLRQHQYEAFKFKRSVLRKFQGNDKVAGNDFVTPHLKAFIIINNNSIDDDTLVYLGSHNFTVAAWGKFSDDFHSLESSNYEFGMVFPLLKDTRLAKAHLIKCLGVELDSPGYAEDEMPFFCE